VPFSSSLRTSSLSQSLLFLVVWNLANTLPWLAAGLFYHYWIAVGGLAWLLACLLVAIAQWLVLERYISGLNQWAIATLIGGIIGASGFAAFILAAFVVPVLTGLAVGIAQWMVLRHKLTAAFWWVFATTTGAIVGLVVGYTMPNFISLSDSNTIENTVFSVGIGIEISSSLITGCTMLWLLKRNANRKSVSERSPNL